MKCLLVQGYLVELLVAYGENIFLQIKQRL